MPKPTTDPAPDSAATPDEEPKRPEPRPQSDRPAIAHRLELQVPIRWGSEVVRVLEFQRAHGKHVFATEADDTTIGQPFRIAAKLARVPYELLEELELEDAAAVQEYTLGVLRPLREAVARVSMRGAAPSEP